MLLSTRTDLELLAKRVGSELATISDRTSLRLEPLVISRPSFGGWFVDLARLPGQRTFTLFLDRSTGRHKREPWYGFSTTRRDDAEVIAKAAASVIGQEPIRDAVARPITKNEYGQLFLEAISSREFYVGIYAPVEALIYPTRTALRRIARFARDVVRVLDGHAGSTPMALEGSLPGIVSTARVRRDILARRGQAAFRNRLIGYYGACCFVSGPHPAFLLEAAHLATAKGRDDHSVSNGILLRPDFHALFDLGHLAVEPVSRKLWLSPEIRKLAQYNDFHLASPQVSKRQLAALDATALAVRWSRLTWTPSSAS